MQLGRGAGYSWQGMPRMQLDCALAGTSEVERMRKFTHRAGNNPTLLYPLRLPCRVRPVHQDQYIRQRVSDVITSLCLLHSTSPAQVASWRTGASGRWRAPQSLYYACFTLLYLLRLPREGPALQGAGNITTLVSTAGVKGCSIITLVSSSAFGRGQATSPLWPAAALQGCSIIKSVSSAFGRGQATSPLWSAAALQGSAATTLISSSPSAWKRAHHHCRKSSHKSIIAQAAQAGKAAAAQATLCRLNTHRKSSCGGNIVLGQAGGLGHKSFTCKAYSHVKPKTKPFKPSKPDPHLTLQQCLPLRALTSLPSSLTILTADGKVVATPRARQPSHPLLHPLHILLPPVLAACQEAGACRKSTHMSHRFRCFGCTGLLHWTAAPGPGCLPGSWGLQEEHTRVTGSAFWDADSVFWDALECYLRLPPLFLAACQEAGACRKSTHVLSHKKTENPSPGMHWTTALECCPQFWLPAW
eukprot:1160952-Pelagomonas_calceolata.AAC.3